MAYKKRSYLIALVIGCGISLAGLLHPLAVDYLTERETIATVCGKELITEEIMLVVYEVRTHNDRMSILGLPNEHNKKLYESLQVGLAYRFTHHGFKGRIKSILTATPVVDQLAKECSADK